VNSWSYNCSPGCLPFSASALRQRPAKAPVIPISAGLPHSPPLSKLEGIRGLAGLVTWPWLEGYRFLGIGEETKN